jgi:toxin CcdB
MARGDLYENRGRGRATAPYLVDLQHDLLDGLDTRVVAPLLRLHLLRRRIERLHPEVEIAGERFAVAMHLLATVPRSEFGKRCGSLAERQHELTNALDLLFSGI